MKRSLMLCETCNLNSKQKRKSRIAFSTCFTYCFCFSIRLNSRKEKGLLKRTGGFFLLLLTGISIQGRNLGRFLSPSEQAMATHSSTLARKSHGRRSLVGCSPWGRKESDTTEQLHFLSLLYEVH